MSYFEEEYLFPATTDVIITDIIQVLFLVFTIERITLAVNDCILCNDTILGRIDLDDFEFHGPHTSTDGEQITLSDGSVRFEEIWFEVDIEEGPSETFDCICDWEDGHTFRVFDVGTWVNGNNVS